MKITMVGIIRIVLVLIFFLAFPTYESMLNSLRPSFTSPGKYGGVAMMDNYLTIKRHGLYFGINVEMWDVNFKERWHRIRLGAPLQAITIDYEERKNQFKGVIETDFYLLNILLAIISITFIEFIFFYIRKRNVSNKCVN